MEAVLKRIKTLTHIPGALTSDPEQFVKETILKGEKFTDKKFPPKISSVFSKNKKKFDAEKVKRWKDRVVWKRIQDIYPKEELDVVKSISPSDAEQGEIGDGYFISSLCSLAQLQPYEIKKIFVTKKFNKAGIYAMRLLVNGQPRIIVVDDYIPYDKIRKTPIFAGKKTKNIWPILLEKAWAKINGSYEDIVTGSSGESFRTLIPYPIIKFRTNDPEVSEEKLWDEIKTSLNYQYFITGSSNASKEESKHLTKQEDSKTGLVTDHGYSIIGAFEVEVRKATEFLIKISNPWGKQSYRGRWGEDDPNWTEELKMHVKYDKREKGDFFMSFRDFCKSFDSVTIGKGDSFFDLDSLRVKQKKGSYTLVKITLPSKSILAVNIHQYMTRLFDESEYTPATIRVMVGK